MVFILGYTDKVCIINEEKKRLSQLREQRLYDQARVKNRWSLEAELETIKRRVLEGGSRGNVENMDLTEKCNLIAQESKNGNVIDERHLDDLKEDNKIDGVMTDEEEAI